MVQKCNAMIGPSLLRGVEPFRPFSALPLSLKASESFNDLYKNEDNGCGVSFVGPLQKTWLCEHVFDIVKGTALLQRASVHHQQRRTVTTLCKIIQKTTLYFMLDFLEILKQEHVEVVNMWGNNHRQLGDRRTNLQWTMWQCQKQPISQYYL